jgi:hypothetical protein
MAEESAKLRIPYIAASQAQKHVTHNEGMTLLDTLVQLAVKDKDLATPPGSPAEGDCYIIAASPTGAWTGWAGRVARFIDGEWRSYLPGVGSGAGWIAYVIDEAALYVFNGTTWGIAGLQLGQYIDFAEISPPSAPGADVARLYAKDWSGTTWLAFKDHAGTERVIGRNALSFRNIAGRSGGFEVWQRGAGDSASIAVAASTTAYTTDGWYLASGANQASVVAAVAGLTNGSKLAARLRRNSGQTGTGVMRFAMPLDVDEVYAARGGILALSFWAKAGANWSPSSGTLNFDVYFGNSGSPAKRGGSAYSGETNPIHGSVNLTPGGAAVQVTLVASGAAGTDLLKGEIQFSWTPAGTAGAADDFSLDDLQLEVVPATNSPATDFERLSFAETFLACQRSYEKSYAYATVPGSAYTAGTANITMSHPSANFAYTYGLKAAKRAAPTVTIYDAAGNSNKVSAYTASWANNQAVAGSYAEENQLYIQSNVTSALYTNFAFVADASI